MTNKLLATYRRNESMNNHSNNIVLLAKNFGTPDELALATEILRERNRLGGLPTRTAHVENVIEWQHDISVRYSPKLYGAA